MKFSFFALTALACATLVFGQSQLGTGSIAGHVLDASGKSVSDAQIRVLSDATGLDRRTNSTGGGDFSVPVLPTGKYMVTVEKAGFSKLEEREVSVTVGSTTNLELRLELGTVTTLVNVADEAPIVDTTQSSEVSLVDRQQIDGLPINGRRYDQFALLAPGVTRDSRVGLLSFHGVAGVFNNFTIEGNDDNQALFSEARGRTRIATSISANAIEEFQVPKSSFLPEYGRTAGGGVNSVVRSGGNAFHFDAFYYFRNSNMSALDPIAKTGGAVQTFEQRQQFGGSIGGHIIRNKLFYFVNYDQQVRPFPLLTSDTTNVLTTGLPANATSAQVLAFNTGVAFLKAQFPQGAPNNTVPRTFNQQSPLIKVDWLINSNNTLTSHYNYLRWSNENAIQTPAVLGNVGRNGSDDVRIHSLNLRLTSTLTPTLVHEGRFQWGRDFEFELSNTTGPQVTVGSSFSYGTATFLQRPAYPDERRYQYTDNLSWIKGTHSLKFGVEMSRAFDILDNPANFAGAFTYTSALTFGQDLLNPAGKSYSGFSQSFGLPGANFGTIDWAGYAQDQWKITRSLTLNYGLRYDYEQMPAVRNPNPAIPQTTKINSNPTNFGPRVNAAWDVFKDGKTVVRGGYGIVYGRVSNGIIFNSLTQTGLTDPTHSTIALSVQPTDSFAPIFPSVLASLPSSATGSVSAYRLASDFKAPRVQEINIGVTRQLGQNVTASVSYVHTYADRLPAVIDSNLPVPNFTRAFQLPDGTTFTVPFSAGVIRTAAGVTQNINLSRPNPNFGALSVNESISKSWYNAMLVEVKRRFNHGLMGGISYTLAKSVNTTGSGDGGGSSETGPFGGGNFQDQFNMAADKGASPLDQRHRGSIYAIYQLPRIAGENRVAKALINGWGMSAIFTGESGRPYSPVLGVNSLQFLGTDGVLYNGFGGLRGQGSSGDRNILPVLGRDSIYGANNYRLDLRVSRSIHVTERLRVEVFAEAFNVANHANYNGFNSTIYNTVATATTTALNAPVALTPVTNFGIANNDGSQPDGTNARRLQVAMRLKF